MSWSTLGATCEIAFIDLFRVGASGAARRNEAHITIPRVFVRGWHAAAGVRLHRFGATSVTVYWRYRVRDGIIGSAPDWPEEVFDAIEERFEASAKAMVPAST